MATLTAVQVAAAAKLGGFSDSQIPTAVAVARGESSFNTTECSGQYCGLWQIGTSVNRGALGGGDWKDPVVNARAAKKLVDERGWCGGRASNGHCQNFEAYGMDNAGMSWSAKLAEGNRALAELRQQMQSGRTPQQILGSASSSAPVTAQPAGIGDLIPGSGAVSAVEGFFGALTQKNTWIRVAEVLLGAVLINIGLQRAAGIDYKKVASLVVTKGASAGATAKKAGSAVKGATA